LKVIQNLEEAKVYKRGWTYVLLSKNKRIMKIGKVTTNLKKRVYQHLHCKSYKPYEFQFLLALDSAQYELLLHRYFDEYRCQYKWLHGEMKGQHFTKKEASIMALKLFKSDSTSYSSTFEAFWENTLVTRNEIFSIPPRKVGLKLEDLIKQIVVNPV
tara:strand:- start:4602 stop:5072 length:471 start_codon:yes stop_codon:yes gene_type:complete